MGLAVVIKLLGRKIGYCQLRNQLHNLWKPTGHLKLTDLDEDCFLVRFQDDMDYQNALLTGPWMVYGHYLTVQPWTPSFKPHDHVINQVIGWIRLPKLPARYYHKSVIRSIGNVFGEVIRVDYNTDSGDRGKFARIAVSLDLTKPLTSKIPVDGELIYVEYEGLPTICFHCGRYGHLQGTCPALRSSSSEVQPEATLVPEPNAPNLHLQARETSQFGAWMQVQRRRRPPAKGDRPNETQGGKKIVSASRYEKKGPESKGLKKPPVGTKQKVTAQPHSNPDNIFQTKQYAAKNSFSSLDPNFNTAIHIEDSRLPRRSKENNGPSFGPPGPVIAKSKTVTRNDPLSNSRGFKLSTGVAIHKLGGKPIPDSAGPSDRSFVANYKPDIFVLLEPRIFGGNADKVIKKLGFHHSHRVEAAGFSGGIWILWSSKAQSFSPQFRFLAPWLAHPDFSMIVKRIWNSDRELFPCLNAFVSEMKIWNLETFGHTGKRKRKLFRRINGIQSKLEDQFDAPSNFLLDLETSLREDLEDVYFQEELLWLQKSSSEWICLGDRNTKYYHMKALIRKKKNFVSQLKITDGSWIQDEDHLAAHVRQYFIDLFSLADPVFKPLSLSGVFPFYLMLYFWSLTKQYL
ncbi:hypothetical protein K1719_015418 [Acacia pycnantha]|nr:hypothetical protein K1719_015418 [Acacia pycnantha]